MSSFYNTYTRRFFLWCRKRTYWGLFYSYIDYIGNNKHSETEPDPEPKTQPNPNPGDSEESGTESEPSPISESDLLPPSNMDNPMFGYCEDKKCRLCPVKSTEKVGNYYYACFTNSSLKCCCQALHCHSKTIILPNI